jgi:hypothetical protein
MFFKARSTCIRFGPISEFGFEKLLQFFRLLKNSSVLPNTRFGIGLVSVTLPHSIRKTRYLSSSYYPTSPHTFRLIIGGCEGLSSLGDTIRAIDSTAYGLNGEPKESVDQDRGWQFSQTFIFSPDW